MFVRVKNCPKELSHILLLLLFFFSACEETGEEGSASQKGEIPEVEPSLQLSLLTDPFVFQKKDDFGINVFRNLLVSKNHQYDLPGSVGPGQLQSLFKDVFASYRLEKDSIHPSIKRQYHAFPHALDVLITTHSLLRSGGGAYLSEEEEASLLLAALGHDALHAGVFNSFLIRSNHKYAREDGNQSIQEKRSLKFLLKLLDSNQILVINENTSEKEKEVILNCRGLIEQSILWTDMARHKEQITAVEGILSEITDKLNQTRKLAGIKVNTVGATTSDINGGVDLSGELSKETRHLIAGFILHCADVSNPGKPWPLCERWANMVIAEFFSQGDLEKKLKMKVSMNCDRETVSIPLSQINFGKYVISDLYELLAKVIGDGGSEILKNYKSNQLNWQSLHEKEKASGVPYSYSFRTD
jgi:hypothetical protein